MELARGTDVAAAMLAALRPPEDLSPAEWAEKHVRIPVGNAVPGPIRFDNAPYQREPVEMSANPDCRRLTLQWGGQVGKTTGMLCMQAFRIGHAPTPQLMMQPSQNDLQVWLETKFNPMVDANPSLASKLAKPRGREGVNNSRMKAYPGGHIMFSWAGSAKTMRGRSAPFVLGDECDGYERTAEGHPMSLFAKRGATFGDRFILVESSTPTFKGSSYIEAGFLAGDQRRFHVACPHCREAQVLVWGQVSWSKDEAGEHLPETAGYACLHCGVLWNDRERFAAIRAAEADGLGWIAARPFRGHASYHLNELYSLFRPLAAIVQSFLDAKAANDLQTFVNLSLAETWEEAGDRVDADALMKRAEPFAAEVPAGALVLTAGVDMQLDRLEVEVVGWGLGEESWSVAHLVLYGDVLERDVWDQLDEVLASRFRHASGADLRISAACVDTGGGKGMTQAAYDYCLRKFGRRVFGIKGVGGWGRALVERSTGKLRPGVPRLHLVGTDEAKLVVMRRFNLTDPGPGFCHIPDSREPEWFMQATAEQLMTRYVRGFPIREWHAQRPRNEALDCRVYALAALRILNPRWPALARKFAEPAEEAEVVAETPAAGSNSSPSKRGAEVNPAVQSVNPGDPDGGSEGSGVNPPAAKAAPKTRRKAGRRKRGGWMAGG